MNQFKKHILDVPDFPIQGVMYRDISPLLSEYFCPTITGLTDLLNPEELSQVEAFAGVDARGFIFASALAVSTGKNVIMVRKAGKLAPPTIRKDYTLEYGVSSIEIKPERPKKVVLVDDVLATGGTMRASADLLVEGGHNVLGLLALIDLRYLNEFIWNGMGVRSLVQYD